MNGVGGFPNGADGLEDEAFARPPTRVRTTSREVAGGGGPKPATGDRAEPVDAAGGRAEPVGAAGGVPPGRRRRRWVIVALVVALVAAGASVVVGDVLTRGDHGNGSVRTGSATSLATVERRSLSTRTLFNGTLGYSGAYTVLARAEGTITWLPSVGRVIRDGHVLYRLDQAPVVLLYGSTPAFRALAEGATGADVEQLNHALVALGDADRSDVEGAWDEFTWVTRAGVERLQAHLGTDRTGRLDLGEVVFLPTAARITAQQAMLGAPATGPVLSASSTAHTVSVALDASRQSEVKAGDRVTVTLPDGGTTPGTVTSVGRVATVPSDGSSGPDGAQSGPTVPVHIRLTHPRAAGSLDQALVEVSITDRTVRDVLAAPVDALLARAGGAFAVEVVAGDGTHHLVPVRPGLFDDAAGMVQVSGPGLAAGQRVVVPGNA